MLQNRIVNRSKKLIKKVEDQYNTINVSKLVSYWLRHKPGEVNIELDEFGWADIEKILSALAEKKIIFQVSDLIRLNKSFDKARWEIDEARSKIRATHGHSLPVILDGKIKIPPATLYHGTAITNVSKIFATGISPMQRQFVHLSENKEAAIDVAKRYGKPFIIEIDTEDMINDGWVFYQTSDNVWLTTAIPAKYLSFTPWIKVGDPEVASEDKDIHLKQLKKEIGNRVSHSLYKHLDDLEMICDHVACDDTLFADNKTGKCYMVHLTWSQKQETDGWPGFNTFNSFENWIENGLWIDQQYYYNFL